MQRARIHDVARAAGVSITTVSHALSGRGKVSPATSERVRRAAKDLGYAPNRIASALRSNLTDILGFVSDEIATTPFAGRIVYGAQEAAAEHGMTVMIVNSNRDPAEERHQVDVLLAQQVDALLVATMFHRAVRTPTVPPSTPVVLVNAVDPDRDTPAFVPDERGLALTATRVLLAAGHTRIAHLTIDTPGFGQDGRIDGFRSAMAEAGLPAHVVAVAGDATATAGRAAFARALEEQPGLTAAFCFNDPMAMGVYQIAGDRGIRIPRDLSVVGVDDLELISAQLRPGLTTLALPHREMGRLAVLDAVARIRAESPLPGSRVQLDCSLTERGSVAAPALSASGIVTRS